MFSNKHILTVATATIALSGALLLPMAAQAQTAASTDEVRAELARSTTQEALASAFDRPVLEDSSSQVPEGGAGNEARVAVYNSFHRDLRDFEAGVRSTPIEVYSSETAREEAARVTRDRELATYVAYMQANPAARIAHQAALSEPALAAK